MLNQDEMVIELFNLCKIKAKEFHEDGYGDVSADEIWEYISIVKKDEGTRLHRFVSSIFSLEIEEFEVWRERKVK